MVLAGFIDGPGPYEGPIKVLAATPEEARERVDHYADLGYVQIKIYSSVKPELVPVIIDEAHKRGLRVSGHVPAGMTAEQFVRDGADEIQHMNFVFLNFWPEVKETRTPARFTEPGKRAAGLDLNSPQVNQFIALLKEHHTVIDPTLTIWEATYMDRPGNISEEDAYMFDRLPLQVQRGAKAAGEALPTPDAATDQLYRASYANFVRMLKKLYDNGITVVAGTDLGKGYSLHRELEIYNQAGIPAPEVLRMATLTAAQIMKRDGEVGSIAPRQTGGHDSGQWRSDGEHQRHPQDRHRHQGRSGDVSRRRCIRPWEFARSSTRFGIMLAEELAIMPDAIAQFANAKYFSLETFRKTGVGVRTPVWFAEDPASPSPTARPRSTSTRCPTRARLSASATIPRFASIPAPCAVTFAGHGSMHVRASAPATRLPKARLSSTRNTA